MAVTQSYFEHALWTKVKTEIVATDRCFIRCPEGICAAHASPKAAIAEMPLLCIPKSDKAARLRSNKFSIYVTNHSILTRNKTIPKECSQVN
jgi:hypothetical protein